MILKPGSQHDNCNAAQCCVGCIGASDCATRRGFGGSRLGDLSRKLTAVLANIAVTVAH